MEEAQDNQQPQQQPIKVKMKVGNVEFEIEGTVDQAARSEVYKELFQKVMDDGAVYPLFHKQYVAALDKKVKGLSNDVTGYPDFNDVYFVK